MSNIDSVETSQMEATQLARVDCHIVFQSYVITPIKHHLSFSVCEDDS